MARPREDGRAYFRLFVDFFQNKKTKAIKRATGSLGIIVYINILCRVNANGYYYKFDDFDDLVIDIAEEIVSEREQLRHVSAKVAESIRYMVDKGYFEKTFFEMNILTSRPIQEEYLNFLKASKRKGTIDIFNLVDVDQNTPKNEEEQEETAVNSEETAVNSEETTQSKVKENTTTTGYGMVGASGDGSSPHPVENLREPPTYAEIFAYFANDLVVDDPNIQTARFIVLNAKRGWDCLPNWKETADLFATHIE